MLRYDRIGPGYASERRAEPRIATALARALGDARTVVNVGAGAGSYEPEDRTVLAVEPSAAMRAQRPSDAAPCIGAFAERLPLADASFDAALAIYSDFHWGDPSRGIAELVRVSRERVVLLTVDRPAAERYWLTRDYFPAGNDLFRDLECVTSALPGECEVTAVPIPHDCRDGFVHAFWRRPRELLDERVRSTMAMFDRLGQSAVDEGARTPARRSRQRRLASAQRRAVRTRRARPRPSSGRLAPASAVRSADLRIDDRAV